MGESALSLVLADYCQSLRRVTRVKEIGQIAFVLMRR